MAAPGKLFRLLGCCAGIALAGCTANGVAPTGGAPLVRPPATGAGWIHAGDLVYHVPQYMRTLSALPATSGIVYHGGPVLTKPKAYLILWGYKKYGDPDKVAKLLREYLKVEGGSGHNNIYTQYYEVIDGEKIYITNPRDQDGGVWDDEQHAVPKSPTEKQVAQEALEGVAHFGYDRNGSYIVATPHGRSTVGFGTQWCAYHSDVHPRGKYVSYTNLPYIPDAGANCGANFIATPPKDERGADEGVTIVAGAQYGKSITDPIPGTGWYPEIGDICEWQDIENDPFRSKSYTMQPMYSLASQSCVQEYK